MLILAASVLTACAGSRPSINAPINLPSLPNDIADCQEVTVLPDSKLLQKDVERLWARDRANLKLCRRNLNTVVYYYNDMKHKLNSDDLRSFAVK